MTELFLIISLIIAIFIIIYLIVKSKKEKNHSPPKRVPYRIDNINSYSNNTRRQPTPINNRSATSIIPANNDYMNYRYCPDCHSRNKENRQVIYKIGQRSFECKQCGCKFNV